MGKENKTLVIEPILRKGVDMKAIENPGENLKNYLNSQEFYIPTTIGEVYTFNPKDVEYRECTMSGSTNPFILVKCMVQKGSGDPRQSWFNLNFLKKQDIDRNYVFSVGSMNAEDLMDTLFRKKTLTVKGTKQISVQKFNKNQPMYETVQVGDELISKPVVKTTNVVVFDEL